MFCVKMDYFSTSCTSSSNVPEFQLQKISNVNPKKVLKNNNWCLLASLLTPLFLVIRQASEWGLLSVSEVETPAFTCVPELKFCFKESQSDPTS